MPAEVIQGTVLLAGVNAAGEPVLLKLNDDGTLSSSGGVSLGSTPSTQAMGDSPSGGSATTASKNDHKHGMPSFGGAGIDVGISSGGIATTPSRSDHVHAIPDLLVTSRMVNLSKSTESIATQETTTSVTYVNLTTTGPTVTLTPNITQDHLLWLVCQSWNSGSNDSIMSVSLGGVAAVDADGRFTGTTIGFTSASHAIALAAASGVAHVAKYRVAAGTGSFRLRRMSGIAS